MNIRCSLVKDRIAAVILILKTLCDHKSEFMIKIPVAIDDGRHRIGTGLYFREIQITAAEIVGLGSITAAIFFDHAFLLNIDFGKCGKFAVKKNAHCNPVTRAL